MSINFPLSPTLEQIYTFADRSWRWDGRAWRTFNTSVGYTGSAGESSFTYSDTAPSNPAIGDRWYDSIDGAELVYTNDGDSAQWVEVAASGFLGQTGYTGSTGSGGGPKITNIDITDSSYTLLDDTAVSTDGGYIKITGSGFESGCQILINNIPATSTTFISGTEVRAQVPATAAGTYIVYLVNTDGGVAIRINGITFSGTPTWVTGSGLSGSADEAISIQLSADGAVSYSLAAGSTLPPGLTLSSEGLLSGTVTGINEETVYNFTVNAIDAELQDSPRSFAITITSGDQQIAYVTALLSPELEVLPFNRDASTNNFAVSVLGDTRPNNFGPYTPGYYSNFFDGTGDSLSLPTTGDIFNFGTGDFTVEAFLNFNTISEQYIAGTYDGANGGWAMYLTSSPVAAINFRNGDGSVVNRTFSFAVGTWYHIAVSRSSSTLRFFVNGIQVGADQTSYTQNITRNNTNGCAVGRYMLSDNQNGGYVNGYISNLRVVKGTAVYTANFTTPAAPLTAISGTSILTCQSNRFIDNSTNAVTVTRNGDVRINGFDPFVIPQGFAGRGSAYFDGGTDDFLTAPAGNAFLLNGDFTVEAYAYFTNAATLYDGIFTTATGNSAPQVGVMISKDSAQMLNGIDNSSGFSYTAPINQWNHIAFVRSGTTIACWLNGTRVGSATTAIVVSTNSPVIGKRYSALSNNFSMNGYICDLRVVKGTAVYDPSSTTISVPTAPLAAVAGTSLLTCQTNQPANNNVFLDSSTNNFLITRNGNTTQGTSSPYGGGWSNYFDGTGDYLTVASSTNFNFSGVDGTVECWIYPTSFASDRIIWGLRNTSIGVLDHMLKLTITSGIIAWSDGSSWNNSSSTPTLNAWNHVAWVKSGTTVKVYLNGSLIFTYGSAYNPSNTARNLSIGSADDNTSNYLGFISNFRIVKGTAVYTAAFTPPVAPLQPITGTSLLTCADNRFVDDSPNNFVITRNGDVRVEKFNPFGIQTAATPTSHSAFFDGTGDHLFLAGSTSAVAYGTSDFTIELWFYALDTTWRTLWDQRNGNNALPSIQWCAVTANKVSFYINNEFRITSTNTFNTGQWHHVAVVRSSGTITLYVNGVNNGTYSYSTSISGAPSYIGDFSGGGYSFNGYISNFRVVNGTAVYTDTFTPPTEPLTAIANTSLLTCQSPTFVDNSSNRFTITAAGNSRPSQTNPFGFTAGAKTSYTPAVYGGSMYFDGTGDFLSVPNSSAFTLGTNSFTIEFWLYPIAATTGWVLGKGDAASAAGSTLSFYLAGTTWDFYSGSSTLGLTKPTLVANTWQHIAVVRNSTTITIYLNGTSVSSLSVGTTSINTTTQPVQLGSYSVGGYNGYVSNFRIVNGAALYTSSFVPPTAPLEPITNTTLLVNGTAAAVRDASMINTLETVGDAKISTTVVKYGTTSMAFDGTGDYLAMSGNTVPIGTGDFTIEGWFWLGATADTYYNLYTSGIFGIRYGNNGFANRLQFSYDLNTLSSIYGCVIQTGNNANQWAHIAWTRSGGINRLFYNGVQQNLGTGINPSTYPVASFTNSTSPPPGGNIGINWLGYIQDFRITKGHARYTANFTPPATAFKKK